MHEFATVFKSLFASAKISLSDRYFLQLLTLHLGHTTHPSLNMAHDEVDASLIINEPRKRKLGSYVKNTDNTSADKEAVVKRMKHTINPGGACEYSEHVDQSISQSKNP